jgi:ApbE superfamily uncharacterized protein (UPF0280 family)
MSPAEDMHDGGRAGRPGHWHAGVARASLPGGRWHFQHGPIDLVIAADGDPAAVGQALECAWERFQSVLTELAGELRLLRKPVELASGVRGSVAQRMVIEAFRRQPGVARAYVNNGGDIAVHLAQGQRYRVGLFADLGRVQRAERWRLDGDFELQPEVPARGVATSGWRGRSFSLGIADSVTVLAGTAAAADAAATLIANAVNVEDPAVVRRPACTLKDDTDLGERPVTVEVGTLSVAAVDEALDAGAAAAGRMLDQDLIWAATLWLQGRNRTRIG